MRPFFDLGIGIVLYAFLYFLIYLSVQILTNIPELWVSYLSSLIITLILFYPPLLLAQLFKKYLASGKWSIFRNLLAILTIIFGLAVGLMFSEFGNELRMTGLTIMVYGSLLSGTISFISIIVASLTSGQSATNKILSLLTFGLAAFATYHYYEWLNGAQDAAPTATLASITAVVLGLFTTALIISIEPNTKKPPQN